MKLDLQEERNFHERSLISLFFRQNLNDQGQHCFNNRQARRAVKGMDLFNHRQFFVEQYRLTRHGDIIKLCLQRILAVATCIIFIVELYPITSVNQTSVTNLILGLL